MPTWGEILAELHASSQARAPLGLGPDIDGIRRKYLAELYGYTGRPVIIYYTDWLTGTTANTAITLEDIQALMEVCKNVPGPDLDLVLHTPGGSPEAVEAIVRYLRTKFTNIRAFIPIAAMSAGTMWALACDKIVMGKHSQLGPIDPQIFQRDRYVPARAIVEQFEKAKAECKADPEALRAWFPILEQYAPGFIAACEDAEELSKRLVRQWLEQYMFAGDPQAADKARVAADWFGDYTIHRSHSLGVSRDAARAQGIEVDDLETDQLLQDAVLSVHHATMHSMGAALKIVENHLGRAYVKMAQQLALPVIQGPPGP